MESIIGGKYRLVRQIGKGGMGAVHEAVDIATGQRVAIKVITAVKGDRDVIASRFAREARAGSNVSSRHIVRVLEAGMDEPSKAPFIAMEYMAGEDLQRVLKRTGPLPPDVAVRIVAQASTGLVHAHAQRIIHRDIKPANLFLEKLAPHDPAGAHLVKVLDFGVAKIRSDPARNVAETSALTSTGAVLGSPLYMAPEQARGLKEIDQRADIWSMGIVLFQALSGRTPQLSGNALGDLIIAICTEPPPPVQGFAPWVPSEIAAVVDRALQIDPDDRFQSAAELLAALENLLPAGNAIGEAMLRSLTEIERVQANPRFSRSAATVSEPQAAPVPVAAVSLPPVPTAPPSEAPKNGTAAVITGSAAFGTTVDAAPSTKRALQAGGASSHSSRGVLYAVLAGLFVALGGLAAYMLLLRSAPSALTPSSPAADVPSAAEAPRIRTVKLAIVPGDALVQVGDRKAPAQDGVVEISGPLGSVHRVHVSAFGAEQIVDVVVAANGAIPAKIELAPPVLAQPTEEPEPPPLLAKPSASPPKPLAPLPGLRTQR